VDEEEYLAMASLNSCLENGGQSMLSHCGRSLKRVVLTGWFAAELYKQWSVFHREGSVLQGLPL